MSHIIQIKNSCCQTCLHRNMENFAFAGEYPYFKCDENEEATAKNDADAMESVAENKPYDLYYHNYDYKKTLMYLAENYYVLEDYPCCNPAFLEGLEIPEQEQNGLDITAIFEKLASLGNIEFTFQETNKEKGKEGNFKKFWAPRKSNKERKNRNPF